MECSERVKNLVAKMTLLNSYWGYLFSRILRIEDKTIPSIMGVTAENDGTVALRFNPEFVNKTDDNALECTLEHEGMHLLNGHIPRLLRIISAELNDKKVQVKMQIWNLAADACANSQIPNFPEFLIIKGEKWPLIYPKTLNLPKGKSTEWYYSQLLKRMKKAKNDNQYEKSFDDHSGWINVSDQTLDQNTLARRIESYVKDVAKQALGNANDSKNLQTKRGVLTSDLKEMIYELLQPPKAPYYQIISKLIKASRISKFKRSSSRINRKRVYSFVLKDMGIPEISPFPGRARDFSFNIGLLLDSSMSMTKDDILEALSGAKNIIENDKHCRVTVIENDTKIQKEYTIKKLKDIQMDIKGRGGTILLPALKRFTELSLDVILVFTDGYCEDINKVDKKYLPKKIIWAVQESGSVEYINRTGFIVRI